MVQINKERRMIQHLRFISLYMNNMNWSALTPKCNKESLPSITFIFPFLQVMVQ